ncbi:hypothetical protein [Krasilnikovia sp. MM14-A1259]|uniref:MinD/ParA family ATP-binding protein n=1 Tax=Krasilnikovia sp. MM14-A1259 TaxID=3373539 RepID=UPI0037F9E566
MTLHASDLFPNAQRARHYGTPPPDAASASSSTPDPAGLTPARLPEPAVPAPESTPGFAPPGASEPLEQAPAAPEQSPGEPFTGTSPSAPGGPSPAAYRTDLPEWAGPAADVLGDEPYDAFVRRVTGGGRSARRPWRERLRRTPGRRTAAPAREAPPPADPAVIRLPVTRTSMVTVCSPAAGAGRTSVTLMLAATLGRYRNGRTLAWEAAGGDGSLGRQAGAKPVFRGSIRDLPYVPGAGFDVLDGDNYAEDRDRPFEWLYAMLSRSYDILVLDSGSDLRAPAWSEVTRRADQLVVPVTVRADCVEAGLWTVRESAARSAIAVLSCTEPQTDPDRIRRIAERFAAMPCEVVVVPFDECLSRAGSAPYREIGDPARQAYLSVATTVMRSLTTA